jgi:hypothetical protein
MPSPGKEGGGGRLGVVFSGLFIDARFELPPLPFPRPLPPLRPPRSTPSWLLFARGVRCCPFPRPLPPRALGGVAGAVLSAIGEFRVELYVWEVRESVLCGFRRILGEFSLSKIFFVLLIVLIVGCVCVCPDVHKAREVLEVKKEFSSRLFCQVQVKIFR